MATIKSYTNIEQSRKLAEILPIESADMHYWLAWRGGISEEYKNIPKVGIPNKYKRRKYLWCPCWSLAALLDVLPKIHGLKPIIDLEEISIQYSGIDLYVIGDNPIDVCYNTIIKLYELKLL